jgi:hypothetical protein
MEQEPPTRPPGRTAPDPVIGAPLMAEAFRLARVRMSAVPASVSGYRLFWVRDGNVGWKDLQAGGPYAIVGTHERCDAVLSEPGVELRHLLATTIELSDGPALRLLDLHTGLPFLLQDDSPHRSIVATGPVVIRLGRTVIGGVPIDAGRAPEPPEPAQALPEMVVERSNRVPVSVHPSRGPLPPVSHPPVPDDAPVSAPPSRKTSVTSMPPSHLVARMQSSRPVGPPQVFEPTRASAGDSSNGPSGARGPFVVPAQNRALPPPPGTADGHWAVTLERANHAASVSLSDEELSAGVVIGRAPNCHDRGLRSVLDTHISRGHLLLLHHHETYEVFDLCSMNGTWEAGRAVKRRRLGADQATLQLAGGAAVVLHWHGRA